MIGTSLAHGAGGAHWGSALAALAVALCIQIGTNFCNDYCDFKKGADTADRVGPLRVTQAGLVTSAAMRRATILVFVLAALAAVTLVVRGGWPMFWIAVFSILSGIAYTAGPYALAYLGLGDVFVLAFFGPIAVGGTYYVQTLTWPPVVMVAGLAPGLLSCAILMVNNLRDIEQDRLAGKKTLPVRFGRAFARRSYLACMAAAIFGVPALCVWFFGMSPWTGLATLSALFAWHPARAILFGTEGAALNPVLGQTTKVLIYYALAFTAGQIIAIFA